MKKILFLTSSYPDFRKSASVLCTHRVMEACAKQKNMEVHCLCMRYEGEKLEDYLNGIHVHRFNMTVFERIMYSALNRTSGVSRIMYQILDRFQKIITIPLYPCITPLLLKRWKSSAISIHKKEEFEIVIAEHHGYNTLISGAYIKKKCHKVAFVPILWDPILGKNNTNKLPKAFTSKRTIDEEKYIAKYADMIISTLSMKGFYEKNIDIAKEKRVYLDIPSVLPPDEIINSNYLSLLKSGRTNIVFSGYIDAQRDPNRILECFNTCKNVERLNILFFCKGVDEKTIKYWKEHFRGDILFHEYIPLKDLHSIYSYSDYLLNISHTNANMVPSKIFEYMSYGRPIISCYKTHGDAAKSYLELYPESCIIDLNTSVSANSEFLDRFFIQKHETVPFETVKSLFPNNTPESFVKLIENIALHK